MTEQSFIQPLRFPDTNLLYHGMQMHHFESLLDHDGYFYPNTTQRCYLDGRMRRDRDDDYDDITHLRWVYGWSMSRCINVSKRFGEIIWVFDRDVLARNHKIRTISWNYTIGSIPLYSLDHKKEKEEFICSGAIGHGPTFNIYRKTYYDIYDDLMDEIDDLNRLGKPVPDELKKRLDEADEITGTGVDEMMSLEKKQGRRIHINQAIGFYIVPMDDRFSKENPDYYLEAMNHEKFLGLVKKNS